MIVLFALICMLVSTYIMTSRHKSFWKIFTVHALVLIAYMIFVINYSKLLTGNDEYGLEQIGLGILFIVGHIIIGFVHGLFIMPKKRQTQ